MMRCLAGLFLCALCVSVSFAQSSEMTGAALRAALLDDVSSLDGIEQDVLVDRGRSVPLAFAMSAVLPGSGQAYNRHWAKAAGLVAAEIAIAAGYITSYNQGVTARDDYQAYAHQYWQPPKYGRWLNDFKIYLNRLNPGREITAPDVQVPTGINFRDPASWSAADERAVREFFDGMRQLEGQLYHAATGASFAHRIPYFGEQQYYELIGKYFHFAPGWEDYPEWIRDGEFLATIDPELQDESGRYVNASARYWEYRDDHARANALFRRASRVSSLFIVNHLIAAIDAAVFAKLHNDRIDARVTMEHDAAGLPVPGAYIRLRF